MDFLKGYKTYVAGALLVLGAVGAWMVGDNEHAYELFAFGLAVVGLRNAIPSKK